MGKEENENTRFGSLGDVIRRVPHSLVFTFSASVGLLLVLALVAPLAPKASTLSLIVRYLVYAILLGGLYWSCDNGKASCGPIPLSPFSGPSAAAVTAGAYLNIVGVPVSAMLCFVIWFGLGFGAYACFHAPIEEREMEVSRQLVALALTCLAYSLVALLAILGNVVAIASTAGQSLF